MSRPGSSPVWTSRSAVGDALREGAGRGLAFAVGAAIGVRGGVEIGAAELFARLPVAARQQLLDAGAVGAGRRAEDARAARLPLLRAASASGLSPSSSSRAATAPTAASISAICAGNMSRNRPEMRQVTSTRGRPSAAGGSTSMPVTRPVAASHCGRQPISARPCAISSPPVRSVALPQRSMTSARGQSPWSCTIAAHHLVGRRAGRARRRSASAWCADRR